MSRRRKAPTEMTKSRAETVAEVDRGPISENRKASTATGDVGV